MNGRSDRAALLTLLLGLAGLAPAAAQHEHHTMPAPAPPATPATPAPGPAGPALTPGPAPNPGVPVYSLDDLERRAMEKNPALALADAAIRAAEGRRLQGGLLPNPVIGVEAEEIPISGEHEDDGKVGVFFSQEVPLGGKLRRNRELLGREVDQARVRAEAQRNRLLAQVRGLFYRTLAAQHRVEVRERLAGVTREAVEITKQLYNVGAADTADQLAVENEASLQDAALSGARIDLDALWAALRSAVGDPALAPGRIGGSLEEGLPVLDREEQHRQWLAQSPALREAEAEVARAEAALARAKGVRAPDLEIEGGVLDRRGDERPGGPDLGREGFAQLGFRVPLFNRNQGGIAAAEADLARARLSAEGARLGLESSFAATFSRYRQAAEQSRTYREGVLPRARTAYEQYLDHYRQMTAAYPQVLIAQRSLFQAEESYLRNLERAWEAVIGIQS
ncbi:MAG TPA: TolC family protein, partial [Thermoanaerobaculia bacterium]|nr:TolC family protein [Thermoanaerobaculia bacterium]